ncbi:unnamed protein product [Pocillopora meandrina]|uniref:Band 7 domain-containing protein n=1 Tax=Pocillopora meandrina TaxID=46732 RepID=A0AAU9WB39_9CNID|nr:unnamed protein product [Pocillopora meandrina]
MDCEMSKSKIVIGIVVVAAIIFVGAMVGTSLRKLSTEEVGVAYNIHEKKLSTEAKREGLHSGSPGYRFIIFPSVFQSISFDDLECLNKDGIEIELNVQFQYRARPKELRDLILQFKDKDSYLKLLKSIAESAIHDSCSAFNTTQLQSERASFQDLVRKTIGRRFDNVGADVEDLQVENIMRPESYEKVIRTKEAAKENIKIAENERPRLVVEAKSEKEEAVKQAEITIQRAESEARVLLSKADAEASSIRAAYAAETAAFQKLKNDTLSNSVAGLLSYLGVRLIAENNNTVNVALDAPAKTKYTYT